MVTLQRRSRAKCYLISVGILLNAGALIAVLTFCLFLDIPVREVTIKADRWLSQTKTPAGKPLRQMLHIIDTTLYPKTTEKKLVNPNLPRPLLSAANPENEYPYQLYDAQGRPEKLTPGLFYPPATARRVYANTTEEILKAIKGATAGDIITIAPGDYSFSGRAIKVTRPAEAKNPIYLRADRLGSVKLLLGTVEGFHISTPYWVFENLTIKGNCKQDQKCEHAFHVVGGAKSFVLRNSIMQDFNAAIKVNGKRSSGAELWPDGGLVEYSVFENSTARDTKTPVTPINIDGADYWIVRGNFIADFAKLRGNKVAYGAYMKGNGSFGIFERNLVMCEDKLGADHDVRVGLSFGGGGTGSRYCRNQSCDSEHTGGIIRNNVILNCSMDVGIYLNKATQTSVYNNLLHNTLGIDIRFPTSSAHITNNLISGRIKTRDGATERSAGNYIDRSCFGYNRRHCFFDSLYAAPDNVDLRLLLMENPVWGKGAPIEHLKEDLCGNQRGTQIDLGPIQYSQGLGCLQAQSPDTR